jgi:hypothetical protein
MYHRHYNDNDIQCAGEDQVSQALKKLATHLGNPKKFRKAAPLLRQLLMDNKVDKSHAGLLFEALKAAMVDPNRAMEAALSKEYVKLFTAASKLNEVIYVRDGWAAL